MRYAIPAFALLVLALTASPLAAQTPVVSFDAPATIACRELFNDDFSADYPGEKLIEATIPTSTFITSTAGEGLIELQYKVYCDRALGRVFDYQPKTQLEAVSGAVTVEKRSETSKSIGFSSGSATTKTIKFGGEFDLSGKDSELRKYEATPETRQVAASGTLHRSRAVYFKFAPSNAWSLEGDRQLTIQLRVPSQWRGGPLTLDCESTRVKRAVLGSFEQPESAGRARFTIAAYMAGDLEAKNFGDRWLRAERLLVQAAEENREAVHKASYPKVVDKLALFVGAAEPKIPGNWLHLLVTQSHDSESSRWTNLLPAPVSAAASDYLIARREFQLFAVGKSSPIVSH